MEFIKWFSLGLIGTLVPFFLFSAYAEEKTSVFDFLPASEARIIFVGDMLFDRQIRVIAERHGGDHIFSCIEDLLESTEVVIGNLEGPITSYPSRSVGSVIGSPENFVFTFPPSTAELLARHNFGIVNIGNNHIGNMGRGGFEQTRTYLEEADVSYFGGLYGQEYVHQRDIGKIKVSFVSYNEFGGLSPEDVAGKIKEERLLGRIVIVYTHWGDEYIDSSARLRPIAKLFAESGASLVIGSHPHVVLPSEIIGETTIYYSLGNFIFDQYWNEDVRNGLAVEVVLSKNGVEEILEHPVEIKRDGTTCPFVQETAV